MAVKSTGPITGRAKYSRVHTTDASGDLTITFPDGLFGAAPVVLASVVTTDAADQYFAEVVGNPTITTAVIKVRKLVGLTLNILSLGLVNLFTSPGARNVHVIAYETL